ncbi:hypothetical protein ACW9HH_32630 [Nocardia gipuzkoensis]
MTATDLLALLAFVILVLQNSARVPLALAELLNACQPVVHAVRSLAAAVSRPLNPPTDARATAATQVADRFDETNSDSVDTDRSPVS